MLIFTGICLGACAPFNYVQPDAPKPLAHVEAINPPPKIAVVLGSGGPRGFAHVGVIKVLEAAGIKPDLVVGSSVGALIGVFWANGWSAAQIEERATGGGPLTIFDPNPFADRGWIRGQKLQNYVNDNLGVASLGQLAKPMIVVATRRQEAPKGASDQTRYNMVKQAVYFREGNIGVAVRASSAVPGIISPVGVSGTEYEDGDESLPVAVSAARAAGAKFVIAVDVSAHPNATPESAPQTWRIRDEARRKRIDPETAKADFLIHPDLGYYASPSSSYAKMCREVGEKTAQAQVADLLAKLKAAGIVITSLPEQPK